MLRRCVWSRNIKNGCSIHIYIYDISSLRVKYQTVAAAAESLQKGTGFCWTSTRFSTNTKGYCILCEQSVSYRFKTYPVCSLPVQQFFDGFAIVRGVCWTHRVHPSLRTKCMGVEKLIVSQLLKKYRALFFFLETDSSSPLSQKPATSTYREPDQSSPRPPISYSEDLFQYFPPSTPRSSKSSLSVSPPVYTSLLPHTCYMPHPSHSSRFDHPNNIEWRVHIIVLLLMELSPLPSYLPPLRHKYSSAPYSRIPSTFLICERPSFNTMYKRKNCTCVFQSLYFLVASWKAKDSGPNGLTKQVGNSWTY